MEIDTQSRAHLISCDHLHDSSGVRLRVAIPTPQISGKPGSLWDEISHAAKRFGELDDALGVAKKLHLTELGQRERVVEPLAAARRAAETARTNARHQLSVAADKRKAIYEPPKLDAQDFTSAQRDAEIRSRYGQMDRKQRDALHGQMARGENDTALHALVRDPMPGGEQKRIIESVWEPRVQRERADELQRLDDMQEEAVAAEGGADALLRAIEQFQTGEPRKPRPTEDVTYGAGPE